MGDNNNKEEADLGKTYQPRVEIDDRAQMIKLYLRGAGCMLFDADDLGVLVERADRARGGFYTYIGRGAAGDDAQ